MEDDRRVSAVMISMLQRRGYEVEHAATATAALEAAPCDLVLLDMNLPDGDGLDVCRALRARNEQVGIIAVTARGEERDRVTGLRVGADDYVVKPFSPAELVARVGAVLRRSDAAPTTGEAPVAFGDVVVDGRARTVAVRGEEVELTAKEFDLLHHLARHAGQVFTRDELMEAVWRYPFYSDTATVTVHVRRVRQKIERDPLNPEHLVTVWGVGYKLVA